MVIHPSCVILVIYLTPHRCLPEHLLEYIDIVSVILFGRNFTVDLVLVETRRG